MTNILFGGHQKSLNRHVTSFHDFAAFHIIDKIVSVPTLEPFPVPHQGAQLPSLTQPDRESVLSTDLPIGIIGAGASGLYAAMILQDLGINYEILESNNRIGGRVYTHRFNGKDGYDAPINTPARYDYFDVGAMRFPRIPFSDRVFDLFENRLDMGSLLIEYKLSSDNTFQYYNTRPPVRATPDPGEDYFHVSQANAGTVPDRYLMQGPSNWAGDVYKYYKDLFGKIDQVPPEKRRAAFQAAWNALTKQDHHSTRGYMLSTIDEPLENGSPSLPSPYRPFPPSVVEWIETFDSATGLYDEAFVESVIDSLDFDWPHPARGNPALEPSPPMQEKWEWVCIDGGSDHMIYRMEEKLLKKPVLGQRVTKMALTQDKNAIAVKIAGGEEKTYSQVICTTPLGCLAAIDTDGLDLLYNQKLAIRALQYDASTKVGIKFQKRWWQDPNVMGSGMTIKGGQSSTDIPIRTCVYPSYGLDCPDAPGVLLASYTWAQDARRLGSLAHGKGTPGDQLLLELTLENLAKLHGITVEQMGPVEDHFAYSWFNDENARGAFALFGPAQFGNPHSDIPSLFAGIKAPGADGRFHIAGEATSAHHAWVLGALNSAWRAVFNALIGDEAKQAKLIKRWGIPDEENGRNLLKLAALARARVL